MSDHDNDNDDGVAALYREGTEEPPPELDRRILAAAAEHARKQQRAGWRALLRPGPAAGLATAAVLVLAVGVLLRSPDAPQLERQATAPAAIESKARDQHAEPAVGRAAEADRVGGLSLQPSAERMADSQIEEVVVTGSRLEQRAGYEAPAARASTPAVPLPPPEESMLEAAEAAPAALQAPAALREPVPSQESAALQDSPRRSAAAVSFRAPGCPGPYPLPEAAVVQTTDTGLAVRVDDEAFTLRCEDGVWIREPDQSNR